jgi:hypothetical protein
MHQFKFSRFLLFLLFIFAVVVPVGFIITALWNNILAVVLHVSVINFWQALGIFLLSRILFGGFPGKPGWAGRRRRRFEMEGMSQKWFNMSPEEKKEFKQGWRERCGRGPSSVTSEKPVTE